MAVSNEYQHPTPVGFRQEARAN